MLLYIAHLTYSKRKQCNCQDTNLDMQQHNIPTTNNQIGYYHYHIIKVP